MAYLLHPDIRGDKLVFTSEDNLWSCDLDGKNPRLILSNLGTITSPRISPDGTKVAFRSTKGTDTVMVQYYLGRVTDRVNRPPLIFANRVLLSAIPLLYAFFSSFNEFIILEVYSGILGSIQNVVMNSYLLDVIPHERKAEYLSIINGFNGVIYLTGALIGGYLLEIMIAHFPLYLALVYSYIIVFSGRFASSFMFLHLKEPEQKGRSPLSLYSLLYRSKQPGNPSGGTLRFR